MAMSPLSTARPLPVPFAYHRVAHVSSAGHMFARRLGWPLARRARSAAVAAWKQEEVVWAEAPVVQVERRAESLYHLAVDISDSRELVGAHRSPGQFVQVRVGESRSTFLAIASPPSTCSTRGLLEFLIKEVEGSTAQLICHLRKGHTLELSQVLGSGFDLTRLSPSHRYSTVILFATGSGISPIRSLLESGFEANMRTDVRLYYGARNLKRMAYQERFKEWESSGVKIVPVLSKPDDGWFGEQGYVQEAFAKAKQIQNPLATGAVLCGHKQMTEDVTSILVAEGVLHENILKNF